MPFLEKYFIGSPTSCADRHVAFEQTYGPDTSYNIAGSG